jgi:hypothetical protein
MLAHLLFCRGLGAWDLNMFSSRFHLGLLFSRRRHGDVVSIVLKKILSRFINNKVDISLMARRNILFA